MKETTTTWTCDRCGKEVDTAISSAAPSPLPPGAMPPPMGMMTPPMPADWREYIPKTSTVLLCDECNTDFAAWILIAPPPRSSK